MLRFAKLALATGAAAARCCTTTPSASSTTPPAPRQALERADEAGWTVISIKDDWATVFAD